MRIRLSVVFTVVVLGLSGAAAGQGPPATGPTTAQATQTIELPTIHVAFDAPAAWQRTQTAKLPGGVLTLAAAPPDAGGARTLLNVAVRTRQPPIEPKEVDAAINGIKRGWQRQDPNVKFDPPQRMTLAAEAATRVTLTATVQGVVAKSCYILSVHDGTLYVIQLTAAPGDFEAADQRMQSTVVKSFRWTAG